ARTARHDQPSLEPTCGRLAGSLSGRPDAHQHGNAHEQPPALDQPPGGMYRSTACRSRSGSGRRSGGGRRERTTREATPASPHTTVTSTAKAFSPAHHIAPTAATKRKSHPTCLIASFSSLRLLLALSWSPAGRAGRAPSVEPSRAP